MSRVFLKVPGSFCFIQEIDKRKNPEEEQKRIERLALKAINKYFSNFSVKNNTDDLTSLR